jgi:virulence factor
MLIAVIGLGGMAEKAYMPILAFRPGIDLLLASRSAETVQRYQEKYRVLRGTTDLEEVVRQRPQAAFVLSPSPTHYDILRRLLEAGIDVFVEKPATLQASQTEELSRMAEAHGCIFMVGFNRRYAPLHQQGKAIWGSRPVGIALFEKFRHRPFHPSLRHQFYDDTIHQIDILRYYCGEGQVVTTVQQVGLGGVLGAISTVAFESGGFAQVVTSLQAGRWNERYSLYGDGLTMEIDAFLRLRVKSGDEEQAWEETYASAWKTTLAARGFEAQINHFFECLDARQEPQTSGWDSVKTQRLLEEMLSKAVSQL